MLGTLVEISLTGSDANALHESANAAFETIASIHELMSFHSAGSDVSRLNNSAPGRVVQIDARSWHVIRIANEISLASDGVFDITVGGAMMARGDLPGMFCREPGQDASYRDIELLDDNRVRIRRPLAIDVGGIAKGYAVDCAVGVLQRMNAAGGCINAGGDLRVFGDEAVPVEVRDPLNPARAGACLDIQECAFATSANYTTDGSFSPAGVVLDARDDARVPCGRSASVRAASCMTADALAKCVLILGQDSGPLLRHFQADGFILRQGGPLLIDAVPHNARSFGTRLPGIDSRGLAVARRKAAMTKSGSSDLAESRFVGAAQ